MVHLAFLLISLDSVYQLTVAALEAALLCTQIGCISSLNWSYVSFSFCYEVKYEAKCTSLDQSRSKDTLITHTMNSIHENKNHLCLYGSIVHLYQQIILENTSFKFICNDHL